MQSLKLLFLIFSADFLAALILISILMLNNYAVSLKRGRRDRNGRHKL